MAAKRGARNGILSLAIKDKAVLYAAYMPFIQNGGLFIPTKKEYEIGDEVFMLLSLMDEPEKLPRCRQGRLGNPQRCWRHQSGWYRRAVQ